MGKLLYAAYPLDLRTTAFFAPESCGRDRMRDERRQATWLN